MSRSRFGNVRRTPSGRYQGRYTAPDGTPRTLGRTFPTKRDAESALNDIRYQIDRDVWMDPKAPPAPEVDRVPTFAEYVDHFHLSRVGKRGGAVKASTRALAESELRDYILPTFGAKPLDDITLSAVREWYGRLQDPTITPHPWRKGDDGKPTALSSSLIRQCYSLLKAILSMAVQEEVIDRNPCRIPRAGQNNYAEPVYLSHAEARAIIGHLTGDVAVLATVALDTACRLGELLALTWVDVKLDAKLLQIRHSVSEVGGRPTITTTKTQESRSVPLDASTASLLRALRQDRDPQPGDRVFLTATGVPLRHRQVQAAWRKAREHVGLSARFHDLRHTALTKLSGEGLPIRVIMKRAGHKSFIAAMNYQRLAEDARLIEGTDAA